MVQLPDLASLSGVIVSLYLLGIPFCCVQSCIVLSVVGCVVSAVHRSDFRERVFDLVAVLCRGRCVLPGVPYQLGFVWIIPSIMRYAIYVFRFCSYGGCLPVFSAHSFV